MIFNKIPKDFIAQYQTVSCFFVHDGEILLLQRQADKRQGGKWGLPAGKVEPTDKSPKAALLREIKEETGWIITGEKLKFLTKVFVKYPDHDFIFHIYQTFLPGKKSPKLTSKEHTAFAWVKPTDALNMNLVKDFAECVKIAFKL